MLGFVLEEPTFAFSYTPTSIQLGHAAKNELQTTDEDFWRAFNLHTSQFLLLLFFSSSIWVHYMTVYRDLWVRWKHDWASCSAIADKANTAGHLMDSVQTLPCHKMILPLQIKSTRRDGVTYKDVWAWGSELWKHGSFSCDFLCLDTRRLCLYTSSKTTVRHKTSGWSTDVIKCH